MTDDTPQATDLVLERTLALTPEQVWAAWTDPAHLVHWFTPAPWTTPSAETDLRPGGRFDTVMRGPNGEVVENHGCYLSVQAPHHLVWTGALRGGFRPNVLEGDDFAFTVELTFTPDGHGTRFRALVMHATVANRDRHEAMGFTTGWSAALDQLEAHMRSQADPTA